eukprot:g521.t1
MMSRRRAEFDELVKGVVNGLPSDLRDKLTQRLTCAYEKPNVHKVSEIIGLKSATEDEVRSLMFFPDEQMMRRHYPVLIKSPFAHHFFLAVFYLIHAKRWDRSKHFILGGGLSSLVELFTAQNLLLRSQAVESFVELTSVDCAEFAWFRAPKKSVIEYRLHRSLLSLNERLLIALMANREHSYPRGRETCLELLAFWLSWVRHVHMKDLRVSSEILSALKMWSVEPKEGETKSLNVRLIEDFSRFRMGDGETAAGHLTSATAQLRAKIAELENAASCLQSALALKTSTCVVQKTKERPCVDYEEDELAELTREIMLRNKSKKVVHAPLAPDRKVPEKISERAKTRDTVDMKISARRKAKSKNKGKSTSFRRRLKAWKKSSSKLSGIMGE